MISTKDKSKRCNPKNNTDHKTFSPSWIKNNIKPLLFSFDSFEVHIIHREIPISTNNIVHTGPKIQFGGLKTGFIMPTYHVFTEEIVKKDPTIPANSQVIILKDNFIAFSYFIKLLAIVRTILSGLRAHTIHTIIHTAIVVSLLANTITTFVKTHAQ